MPKQALVLELNTSPQLGLAAFQFAAAQGFEKLAVYALNAGPSACKRLQIELERLRYLSEFTGEFELCPLPDTLAQAFSPDMTILLLPQSLSVDAQNSELLDLYFSEPMSQLMVGLEAAGVALAEAELEALCRLSETQKVPDAGFFLAEHRRLLQTWSALSLAEAEAEVSQGFGTKLCDINALALWQDGLLAESRELLDALILRAAHDPQDWVAQIALLLYRRRMQNLPLEKAPDWVQALYAELVPGNRLLTLLPPLQDFRVTVVLPTYSRLELLKKAVATVQAQTSADWLLLIGNDASKDETPTYLDQLAQTDSRIQVIHNAQNQGFAGTMQILLAHAQTELVVNYADDQFMQPDLVATTQAFFKAHPWICAAGGGLQISRPDGTGALQHGPYYGQAQIAEAQRELQRHGMICPLGPTWVYRKQCLAEIAAEDTWFCPEGKGYALWDYLISARLMARYEMGYLPEVVMKMFYAEDTMSAQRDNTYDLFHLLQGLLRDYSELFEHPFPLPLAEYYVHFRQLEMLEQFKQKILSADSHEALNRQAERQLKTWHLWHDVKAAIETFCAQDSEVLINMQMPYR